jgi:pullulanase-type alpha-1,6-glucosidase
VELGINEAVAALTGDLQQFMVKNDGDEIYFGYTPAAKEFLVSTEGAPHGKLAAAKAHWVTRDTVVWDLLGSSTYTYTLYHSPTGSLTLGVKGITGGEALPLTFSRAGPGDAVLKKYPHLAGFVTLKLSPDDVAKVPDILKGQIAVMAQDKNGKLVDATGVQLPGVLDDLYTYTGPLGVTFDGDVPTLRVWAPTAKFVTLYLFDNATASDAQKLPMALDQATGVWSVSGQPDWKGKFYLYAVQAYVPTTRKVETNLVTDPYSFSLSTNSKRSQIVDLTDAALKPPGWDMLASRKPALAAPEDIVIYELHIRDFSIADQTAPENYRGTYMAFTVKDSNGMKHLAALAQAGLTHIHLLPAFDIASVNEDKSTWESVDEAALAALPPDSDQQAAAVSAIKGNGGFAGAMTHCTTPHPRAVTPPTRTARRASWNSARWCNR